MKKNINCDNFDLSKVLKDEIGDGDVFYLNSNSFRFFKFCYYKDRYLGKIAKVETVPLYTYIKIIPMLFKCRYKIIDNIDLGYDTVTELSTNREFISLHYGNFYLTKEEIREEERKNSESGIMWGEGKERLNELYENSINEFQYRADLASYYPVFVAIDQFLPTWYILPKEWHRFNAFKINNYTTEQYMKYTDEERKLYLDFITSFAKEECNRSINKLLLDVEEEYKKKRKL